MDIWDYSLPDFTTKDLEQEGLPSGFGDLGYDNLVGAELTTHPEEPKATVEKVMTKNDDSPSCHNCGHIMVPGDHVTHVCYKCVLCGATSGCSESLERAALDDPPKESVLEGDPPRFDLAG